jgi:hypothetical protein
VLDQNSRAWYYRSLIFGRIKKMNTLRPSPFDTGEIDLDDDYYELSEDEIKEMWAQALSEDLGLEE